MSASSLTALEFVVAARSLVGKPFVHQGRGVGGVDCIGLLGTAALVCSADLAKKFSTVDIKNYGRNPSSQLLAITRATCIPTGKPVVGALLLFQLPGAEYPHHFAVYTEKGTIIHAESERAKCVVEQTFGRPWTRWLHSVWLIPGVEYI